jgi:trigger factor
MKGFRKGKVPMALLRKQFGPRFWARRCRKPSTARCRSISRTSGDRPAFQPEVKMANEAGRKATTCSSR